MTSPFTDDDARTALAALGRADNGLAPVEVIEPWSYFGYPVYRFEGWTICVFSDCDGWDYLEWIETPDGRRYDFNDLVPSGLPWDTMAAQVALWRAENTAVDGPWRWGRLKKVEGQ